MQDENKSPPVLHRVTGSAVILASVVLTGLALLFAANPLQPVPKHLGGLFFLGLLVSSVVSIGGGAYMFVATKQRWWLLVALPVVVVVLVWMLVALMTQSFHLARRSKQLLVVTGLETG